MRERIERALCALDDMERAAQGQSPLHALDARAKTAAALLYIVTMLSVPLTRLSDLLLYALFPIAGSAAGGMSYGAVFRRSLIVLPFAAMVGIFNPIYDREAMFDVGGVIVTRGWVMFLSILLRGMLSVQMIVVLIRSTGYGRLCRALQRMGVPAVFTSQLLFVFRYTRLLSEQALEMSRARDARGFGRRSYPIGMWAESVGLLLVRTADRAEQIHRAMLARGFTGRIPATGADACGRWRRDTVFIAVWCGVLAALRMLHPAEALFS